MASGYAAAGEGRIWPGLSRFMTLLPKAGAVLELGSGAGREATVLRDAGFRVDPTDGSPEMVAEARAWTGLPVRVMRFDELEAEAAYDGVLANACLLHVPMADLPDILARIHRALKPGGWHVASYKTGGPAARDAHGRYFNRPDPEALAAAYRDAGFAEPEIGKSHGGGYFNEPSDWLTVTVRRRVE